MPGRGRPWREGGIVDDTVTSDDIKQGTIKFEDLDEDLQEQIEEGGGGGSGLPVIGAYEVTMEGTDATIDITLTETINFDDTVSELIIVSTMGLQSNPDAIRTTLNNSTDTWTNAFIRVNTSGTVSGSYASQNYLGSNETVVAGGTMSYYKYSIGIGGALSGNLPVALMVESCAGPSGVIYRTGRGALETSNTNITSVQVFTASGEFFKAGTNVTVYKVPRT